MLARMKKQFAILLAVLSICAGCAKIEMAQMERKTRQDANLMVQRYKEASVSQVEAVLNDYLALADDSEKRGWEKYGSPGWIEHHRAMCEGRLAVSWRGGNFLGYRYLFRRLVVDTTVVGDFVHPAVFP